MVTELSEEDQQLRDIVNRLAGEPVEELQAGDPWKIIKPGYIIQDGSIIGVNLTRIELTELPTELLEYPLQELYLHDTGLENLEGLEQLSKLKHLFLPGQVVFPEEVLQLHNLERLTINGGEISSIPDVSSLTNLEQLFLSRNQLSLKPKDIEALAGCPRIELLALNQNRVEEIPEQIGELQQLRHLGLGGNQISQLSAAVVDALCTIKTLELLDLSDNRLRALPDNFSQLNFLHRLEIKDNQWEEIPPVLLDLSEHLEVEYETEDKENGFLSNF